MSGETDFAQHIKDVALKVWGEPNKRLSGAKKICWGDGGARVADLEKGQWYDHRTAVGGGVLDLISREMSVDKAGAVRWMVKEGLIEKRAQQQSRRAQPDSTSSRPAGGGKMEIVETYPYTDQDGALIYEVVRYQWKMPDGQWAVGKGGKTKKTFRQRRPAGDGTWIMSLSAGEFMQTNSGGPWFLVNDDRASRFPDSPRKTINDPIEHSIYRWPQIEIAISEGRQIFIVEGEKDVHSLEEWGITATTNSGGAKNWKEEFGAIFKGASVVVCIDNDEPGREHGEWVCKTLKQQASSVYLFDISKFWKSSGPHADVSDWKASGGSADQLTEFLTHVPEWTPSPPKSKYGAIIWQNIGTGARSHEWLVKGIIERAGVCLIPGAQQSGKSFFMLDLAMSVARGLDYGGRKTRQGLVLYQAGEAGKGMEKRIAGYRRAHSVASEDKVPFVLLPGKINLFSDENGDANFIEEALKWQEWVGQKLEFIGIDTMSNAITGANEISSEHMSVVIERVIQIAERCDAAVGLAHHMGAEGKRSRGSTIIESNVPTIIEIRATDKKDEDGRQIRKAWLAKNKEGTAQFGWNFVLHGVRLGEDEDGDPVTTCYITPPKGHEEANESRLTENENLAMHALQEAISAHGVKPPLGLGVSAAIQQVVGLDEFARAAFKIWPFVDKQSETSDQRQERFEKELKGALQRAIKALQGRGYVGRNNHHRLIWWTGKEVSGAKKSDRSRVRLAFPDKQQTPSDIPQSVLDEVAGDELPF
jgi:5S rRNA maturation endonuclease (ribonuclease M5)